MIEELIGEVVFGLFVLFWVWVAFYGPYSERARRKYMERQIARCDAIAKSKIKKREQ
jgi:hypothetical protein